MYRGYLQADAAPAFDDVHQKLPIIEVACWAHARRRLRDLVKFEFFFADKEKYERDLRAEVALHDREWETSIAGGPNAVLDTARRIRPYSAHRVLRPFLEAYRVVTDILEYGDVAPSDERAFMQACLALGKQYRLQKRIRSAESISKALFATALKLAANRGLLGEGEDVVCDRRRQLAAEIRDTIRFIDAIESLARGRQAGLLR
jgi:glycerol-3-phosphate O-acyltransferase